LNVIISIVQQNYFADLYAAKTLDLSAKSFFSCIETGRSLPSNLKRVWNERKLICTVKFF